MNPNNFFAEFPISTQEEWWNDALKTAKVTEKSALMMHTEENLTISPIYTAETKPFAKILPKKSENGFSFQHFDTIKPNFKLDAEVYFYENKAKDNNISQAEAQLLPLADFFKGKNQNFVFSARGFKENGANVSQQLGFLLAKWVTQVEYCVEVEEFMAQKGMSLPIIAQNTTWQVSIGRNYFVEIAKIRACRILWARILEIYNIDNQIPLEIHAFTGINNKSFADIENNLLRNTTEAMSAIIGNVDILTVFPHDFPHKPTENTKRWAENIANLLTDEARITKTQDILAGAYCVEALTQEICENAWVFFQKIMAKGGVFHVDCREFLENECAKNIAHIENNLKNKKTALVGVHIYPISKDAPPKTFTKDADVLSVYNEGWKIVFLEELGLEKH